MRTSAHSLSLKIQSFSYRISSRADERFLLGMKEDPAEEKAEMGFSRSAFTTFYPPF